MFLGLYHVVVPSEMSLDLVLKFLGAYQVRGEQSSRVWAYKNLLFYFISYMFICIFAVGNVNIHLKLSSNYSQSTSFLFKHQKSCLKAFYEN